MASHFIEPPVSSIATQTLPIGSVTQVLRSGLNYKAVGEIVQRSKYPDLSAAFPRNGAFSSALGNFPSALFIAGITSGAGVFVAVCCGNASGAKTATDIAFVSGDGQNWRSIKMPSSALWSGVIYGGGLFIAWTNNSVAATSTDGVKWTLISMGVAGAPVSIVYGNGLFVALPSGSASSVYTSPDGLTWTSRTIPISATYSLIYFANGVFVIQSSASVAATSPNGVAWTARSFPAAFTAMAASGSVIVAITTLAAYTSTDMLTWTLQQSPYGMTQSSICYGNGAFIIAGTVANNNCATVSYDGVNWGPIKSMPSIGGTVGIPNFCYAAGVFVLAAGFYNSPSLTSYLNLFAEDLTTSDYLYLSGTPGTFVRVA